jgi:hypothetical protein
VTVDGDVLVADLGPHRVELLDDNQLMVVALSGDDGVS